jgi:LCP family protein required for cell wall assembly
MARHAPLAELIPPDADTARAVPDAPAPKRPRRAPLWAKAFIAMGSVLTLLPAATLIGGKLIANRYENSVQRDDLLGDAAPTSKQPPKVTGPLTFLVIGSDSREGANANPDTRDGSAAAVPGERSDTIILMHIPESMDRGYVISFPRDTYVPIAEKNGDGIAGHNKINAAYAFGGAPQLVKTINRFTGLTIDYPVIVNFNAIRKITNLVGGVDVVVDKTSYDEYRFLPANTKLPWTPCRDTHGRRQRCLTFKAGPLHLDGQLAEYYVRQRTGLPNGDLDRAKRQQQFMRALMSKAASGGMLTNPKKFDELVIAIASSLTVDKRMPVQGLAFALKSFRPTDLTFMTVPTAGFGTEPGAGSVVYADKPKAAELFTALKNGTLDQYLLKYPTASNDVSHGS